MFVAYVLKSEIGLERKGTYDLIYNNNYIFIIFSFINFIEAGWLQLKFTRKFRKLMANIILV